jgi:hypothetical protein
MNDGTNADPDYLEFLAMLEQGPEALPSAAAQLEAQERAAVSASAASGGSPSASTVVVTPLMEYIQQKYSSGNMKLGGARGKKKKDEITVTSIKASYKEGGMDWLPSVTPLVLLPLGATKTQGKDRGSTG